MSNRIKKKIKNLNHLKLILEDLNDSIQPGIEIILDLKENKETMSYLCRSKYIEDWDYTAENKKEAVEEIAEKLPSEDKMEVEVENEELGFFKNLGIEQGDWNMIAWCIEAIRKTASTRSAVIFQTKFFYDSVKENIQKIISPEHALLTMTGESYYSDYPWDLVEKDLSEKLHKLWPNKLKELSLTEVATILYKK